MADRVKPVEIGKWYYFCYCQNCKRAIALMEDPSRGNVQLTGPGLFQLACVHCGRTYNYPTTAFDVGPAERVN